MQISLSKPQNMFQNGHFPIFNLFGGHFCYHSTEYQIFRLLISNIYSNVTTNGKAQYDIRKFSKNVRKSFARCKYDEGNFDLLRTKFSETSRDAISQFCRKLNKSHTLLTECIPNKTVCIRPSDPPWFTTAIRRQIRDHKRAYRKAKSLGTPHTWNTF